MSIELYFLRSSENKIITDMLPYAYKLDEVAKSLSDVPELLIYNDFFGLSSKDLGLYAMIEHKIAGAIWSRKLREAENSTAFINEETPIINITVLPAFRNQGVATAMMTQFLQEAGQSYNQLSVNATNETKIFFEKFGFKVVENSQTKSIIDGSEIFTMLKELELKEVVRPSDDYDASYWIE